MKMMFFSDPHLGATRVAHTTPRSRARLRDLLYNDVQNIIAMGAMEEGAIICGGDLFDKASNPEVVIGQGLTVASQCELVLAGNHDMLNRENALSSFDLISRIVEGNGSACPTLGVGQKGCLKLHNDESGVTVHAVPHHSEQALFDDTVKELCDQEREDKTYISIVLLHCTLGMEEFTDASETSLNITRAQVEALLEDHDYVLIGHEHVPRREYGNRVIVMGNTRPLSMGELGDRYIWELDTVRKRFEPIRIYSSEEKEATLRYVPGKTNTLQVNSNVEYVELTGRISAADAPEAAAWISTFWADHPNLLMLRNRIEIGAVEWKTSGDDGVSITQFREFLNRELSGTDLAEVWRKYNDQID